MRHDCILQRGRLRIAEGQQALLARLRRLVGTTALVSTSSVASLSVASHICVCEQIDQRPNPLNVLRESSAWRASLGLGHVSDAFTGPDTRRGQQLSNLLVLLPMGKFSNLCVRWALPSSHPYLTDLPTLTSNPCMVAHVQAAGEVLLRSAFMQGPLLYLNAL